MCVCVCVCVFACCLTPCCVVVGVVVCRGVVCRVVVCGVVVCRVVVCRVALCLQSEQRRRPLSRSPSAPAAQSPVGSLVVASAHGLVDACVSIFTGLFFSSLERWLSPEGFRPTPVYFNITFPQWVGNSYLFGILNVSNIDINSGHQCKMQRYSEMTKETNK